MTKPKDNFRLNAPAETSFLKQLIGQIKKVQLHDIGSLILLIFSFIPGKIWKMIWPNIWVVSEYEYLARDNGYWFYKYVRESHPEIKVYYPIKKDCADAKKIITLGNNVDFYSFQHYILFWAANKQFTSSKNAGFPSRICEDLVQWNFHGFEYIMLNHGITRGKSTVVDPDKTNFDYICTCSDLDRKIIIEDNGQPEEKVLTTGFARHDNLNIGTHDITNTIVVMPTWRSWLNAKYARDKKQLEEFTENFLNSKYYSAFQSLLNSSVLIEWLEKNQIHLYFYLHDYAQYFRKFYTTTSKNIHIESIETSDVQELLIKGDLLITDYSSVCYDFAYMEKPVLYYQFDKEEFEYYQYKAGNHYSYENDGVGDICLNEGILIEKIFQYHNESYKMQKKYVRRVANFFKYRDKNNCTRIFEQTKN